MPTHNTRAISMSRASSLRGLLFCALTFGALAGCVTSPPVQEMSDARQAISAAEQADAGRLAPDTLGAARRFLEEAERELREEAYGPARLNAVRARNRAVQALTSAQGSADVSESR